MEIISSRPTASSLYSLRDGDSKPRRPCWTFTSCLLLSRSPAHLWIPYSSVYDVFFVTTAYGYYGLQYIPGIGRMATAVRLAFVDFIERSSTKGSVPRKGFLCWFFWESVNFRVPGFTCLSVWGGLLHLHLEKKKRKDLSLSGFHLDVQCSDQYKGYRGSYAQPGRSSVYVSKCVCKRNERQRFPFGDVMG